MKRSRVDWSYRLRVRNLAVTAALGIGGWLAYELVYGFVPGIVGLGSRGPFQGTDALFSQGLLYIGVISALFAVGYRLYVVDSDRSLDDGWVSERTNSYINSRRGTLLFWFGVSFGYLPLVVLIVGLTYIVRTLGASEALQDAVYNAFLGTVRVSGLALGLILLGILTWYSVLIVASHRGDEKAGTG